MKSVWRISLLVLVVLVLGAFSALAADFTVGGKVIYGNFTMMCDESDRYGTTFPLFALDGTLSFASGLKFETELIGGYSGVGIDSLGYYRGSDGYSPYVYGSLKADVSYPVMENVSAFVGVTGFSAALDWYNSTTDHDWYPVVGSGYKLGFAAAYPINQKLVASLKYAYLPYVYAIEDGSSYEWLGTGEELEAKLSYAYSDRFSWEAGYKSDSYAGWTSCCEYPADVEMGGIFAGARFRF